MQCKLTVLKHPSGLCHDAVEEFGGGEPQKHAGSCAPSCDVSNKSSVSLMQEPVPSVGASLMAQLVESPPAMQETLVRFLGQGDPLEKKLATHSSILGFLGGSAGKESPCNAGDPGSIPGTGRSHREGIRYLLQQFWASLVAQMAKNLPPV